MGLLPKKYLRIYDVAEYLNNLDAGYKYDLLDPFDRNKLNDDIYDLIVHGELKAVFKSWSDNFKEAYFIAHDRQIGQILRFNNLAETIGQHSIYRYADGVEPENKVFCNIIGDGVIGFDDIYIPRDELDKLFSVQNSELKPTASIKIPAPTVTQTQPPSNEQLIKELAAAKAEIADLEEQLKQAKAEQADAPADDKELPSKSQAGVARMLYAILTEHGYDLSPMKGKGVANDMIVSAANTHGTSVTRNFVADWLIRAREVKINNTK